MCFKAGQVRLSALERCVITASLQKTILKILMAKLVEEKKKLHAYFQDSKTKLGCGVGKSIMRIMLKSLTGLFCGFILGV